MLVENVVVHEKLNATALVELEAVPQMRIATRVVVQVYILVLHAMGQENKLIEIKKSLE
jgi:hypothetical protein